MVESSNPSIGTSSSAGPMSSNPSRKSSLPQPGRPSVWRKQKNTPATSTQSRHRKTTWRSIRPPCISIWRPTTPFPSGESKKRLHQASDRSGPGPASKWFCGTICLPVLRVTCNSVATQIPSIVSRRLTIMYLRSTLFSTQWIDRTMKSLSCRTKTSSLV